MEQSIKSYEDILEQAWTDENFKNRFITDPKAVLIQIGAKIPDSVKVEVHEDTPTLKNFVLPLNLNPQNNGELKPDSPIAAVMKKASNDDNFKAQLLQNSKAAIEEVTGQAVPNELTVRVYADSPTIKHLVLPIQPETDEISESELEMVSGGSGFSIGSQWLQQLGGIKLPGSIFAGFMPINNWLR
ncbi:MAG: NHLP leader peptide family RiPP precursor [Coleofasciculus sp. S288]|nr:NHLP leader peptide family RiPP precursor [Coleofasciculus sp. S288]